MLYERFGYDEARIQEQLALIGLSESDHALVEVLQALVLRPHGRAIVARFYAALKSDRRFWEVMSRGVSLPRLHRSQLMALGTLGRDFDTRGYFETRLRIGVAHARARVPLELYLGSYRVLAQEIVDTIPRQHPEREALQRLVLKLVMLDVSVVSATYHQADTAELQRLLDRTRSDVHVQQERARRDSLTAVFRREHVEDVLDTAIEAAERGGQQLSIAMIDIDHFKRVNDQHGHLVGDDVLRLVAHRMRLAIRDVDTLGRYGGEEFLLVLCGVGPAAAHEIVDRMRERVAKEPIEIGALRLPITISAGVTSFVEGDHGREALVRRADAALYDAKKAGRDRVRIREAPVRSEQA